jgi:hypothetical protein
MPARAGRSAVEAVEPVEPVEPDKAPVPVPVVRKVR